MAGFYADVPGHRMACDRDGSLLMLDGGIVSNAILVEVTDEDTVNSGFGNVINTATIVFPEARDMAGIYFQYAGSGGDVAAVATSGDTTNGVDGTWTNRITTLSENVGANTPTACRTITSLTTTSVKGVRVTPAFQNGRQLFTFHLYGTASSGANPDRLALWDPTTDVALGGAYFDFGDTPRNSLATKSFRIKNLSATKTASAPALSFQYLYDASPTMVGQFQFSLDGGSSWITTGSLSSTITAGSIHSTVVQLRRNTSATAALSAWQGRLVATTTMT